MTGLRSHSVVARGWGRGHRNLTHKASLHDDFAVGKLLPQCFLSLRAPCAYERAEVKNFTKEIARQNSRVDTTLALEFVGIIPQA